MRLVVLIAFLGVLAGCAVASYTHGRDFPAGSIGQIQKGVTTGEQVSELFGPPFMKTIVSEAQEKWIYTYLAGHAKAQSYVVGAKVTSTGTQKTLELLMEGGVVVNYSYNEGPINSSSQ